MSEEIIMTCANCKYYHSRLTDSREDFHIHDYCDLWRTEIPTYTIFDRADLSCGYDDIDTGVAMCWGFEPGENIRTRFFSNEDKENL